MRVLLRAPLLTNSGYGVHSRQIFEWLYERKDINLDVECLNWGMTSWVLDAKRFDGLINKIMTCSRKITPPYDYSIQVQLPDEWDNKLGNKNIGVSAFIETDRCSPAWVDACNNTDHVIVPSTFTKNVIKRSGELTTKVSVIPEWYNHKILDEKIDTQGDDRYKFNTDFNFLMISQLTSRNHNDDRKNIFNTLKWICETFDDNKDVGIVIKTNVGKGSIIDRKMTESLLRKMIKAIGRKLYPKIYLLHGNMLESEIASLYHHPKIKCFVSATRGEGYGLPLIDAGVASMPIVATNWSGHLEFLNRDYFYPVDYCLEEINESKVDNRIFYKGFRWAQPKKESFVRQIKSVYNDYETATEKAKKMSEKIKNNFHKNEIKKLYNEILK